jgi:uncharacterized protein
MISRLPLDQQLESLRVVLSRNDILYVHSGDRSWEAEDTVIKTGRKVFAGLSAEVGIRNEARVRLWYQDKFGVPCPPYDSTEAAIDSFAATNCCLGVRVEVDGQWRVYAPHGLSDVSNLVVRPNPVLAPRAVYEAKAARWREQWPELTVLDWPSTSVMSGLFRRLTSAA